MAKLKTGPRIILVAAGIGAVLFGARWYIQNHGEAKMASSVPQDAAGIEFKESETAEAPATGVTPTNLPSTTLAHVSGPKIKAMILPWNAQMGFNLANGGPQTTAGSLMEKYKVNLSIERQDDYAKLKEALVTCATELSEGARVCTKGANFVSIMGDGAPPFFAGLNAELEKIGPEYKAEIIGSSGRSFGEDKFMAPPTVKDSPQAARGLLVAGYLMDGDWNLAIFWAAQNDICNNPDPATYDPNCINWVSTASFVEADEKYIQGYCEERPIVKTDAATGKTKRTGETKKVCVNGVVTWTPGDVAVAKNKGGLASIFSTRENGGQMPQVLIGIKKWNASNRKSVIGMLKATFEAGEQIKTGGVTVLQRAAEASAKIYKDPELKAADWARYYKGVETEDKQGLPIRLGGSRVFNLADNLKYYGLIDGEPNSYEMTYKVFGDYAVHYYPKDLPSYPPVEEVLNLSYIQEIAAEGQLAKGHVDAPVFEDAPATSETIAKRSWRINFDTGKATFGPGAEQDLKQLLDTLVLASETIVEVHGHTDATGTPDGNVRLSESRAFAVRKYLETKAAGAFPEGRLKVRAHGQDAPVASNDTPEGRALNRRVDIVLKANN